MYLQLNFSLYMFHRNKQFKIDWKIMLQWYDEIMNKGHQIFCIQQNDCSRSTEK